MKVPIFKFLITYITGTVWFVSSGFPCLVGFTGSFRIFGICNGYYGPNGDLMVHSHFCYSNYKEWSFLILYSHVIHKLLLLIKSFTKSRSAQGTMHCCAHSIRTELFLNYVHTNTISQQNWSFSSPRIYL